MINNRKSKKKEKLLSEFGNLKDDNFDFELIETYFRNKEHTNDFQVLSDKTCNDLDFKELFRFIDRTNSKIGQQFLYDKLRSIPSDAKDINRDEKLTGEFTTNADFRVFVRIPF